MKVINVTIILFPSGKRKRAVPCWGFRFQGIRKSDAGQKEVWPLERPGGRNQGNQGDQQPLPQTPPLHLVTESLQKLDEQEV